jgi:SAM-dependent methyltransferase
MCPMCGGTDYEVITPAWLADESFCNVQKIVLCQCGMVYKNPVIPSLSRVVYEDFNWGNDSVWKEHFCDVSRNLHIIDSVRSIVEIGPGLGWLAGYLLGRLDASYVMIEPSESVVRFLVETLPGVSVIQETWESVEIAEKSADLILCCGVDYLFPDIRVGMNKIHRTMKDTGLLYIERNVFLESEAFAWNQIRTKKDLFGSNALMTTWFSVEQYRDFLSMFFEIIDSWSYVLGMVGDKKIEIHGFLCRKRLCSRREHSMKILDNL